MSSGETSPVRTRFAPSPSGHLHVGGARTALFCWAYAKGRGGRFILRIEDTDQKRSSDASSLGFLKDLAWLGIDWDEGPVHGRCGGGDFGPYHQSQRLATYRRFADQLIAEGKAYRAFETPEELEAARLRAKDEKRAYRYDRASMRLDPARIAAYLAEGRPHVVRFKAPQDRRVIVRDEVLGDVETAPGEIDDFVIIKADGYPTYHFAVVVDDELMGVTHVIRAQEHLNNTPRHVLLQEAMGFRRPVFAHVSIIFNPDGSKMSKRDKDKVLRAAVKKAGLAEPPGTRGGDGPSVDGETWRWWLADKDHQLPLEAAEALADALEVHLPEINVDDFRRAGYLPEVLVNYLALLGWSPGENIEKFDRAFLLERFDLDRVLKSPAKFDRDKLLAFNLDALQAMSTEEFARRFREHCAAFHPEFIERLSPAKFDLLARANHKRSKTLDDPIRSSRFFVIDDDRVDYPMTKAVQDVLTKGEPCGYTHLEAIAPILAAAQDWLPAALEEAVKGYAAMHAQGKLGAVAQPLRVAVSGSVESPAIFDTLAILGRDSTLRRIGRCLSFRAAPARS
jgi:glutamyl-tRNA synthetase